jgi:predicted AAA+ superfamily ATPase
VYFWGSHNGAEIDLLLLKNGKRIGVECKRKDAPRLSPSMKIAMEDLQLDRLIVFYPGEKAYPLTDRIEVVPLASLADVDKISII